MKKSSSSTIKSLGERYIKRTCADFPQWGSSLGLSQYEPFLSGSSAQTRRKRILFLEVLLAETEALSSKGLTPDDWLDRRCFLSLLRTELLNSRDLLRWQTNPQECCDGAVGALFELLLRHADHLEKARPSIESRLAAIPLFLKEGAAAIRQPVPLWSKLAIHSCKSSRDFVETLGERLSKLSPDSRKAQKTRLLARTAAKAFDAYAAAIKKKKQGDPKGFSIGRERFEYLVRERCGLDWSLPEIEAEGNRLIAEIRAELEKEAKKLTRNLGRKKAADLLKEARNSWMPEAPLLELYTRSSNRWRQRVIKSRLFTLPPGETLKVTPVADFMRDHFPTAAYSAPGAFEKRQRGIFWVNDLGATKKDPAEALREARQHYGLELTSAHEGYPGHHLQFAIQNRHPSHLRRLFSHAIFYEGWTMWCEKMAIEQGWVADPQARLQQLHDALWRAYRIIIDAGLHSGKLTHETAARILVEGVGFTPARARADVNWYTAAPTVPMSYLLGRLELERVKNRLLGSKKDDGKKWTLREFHDWALSHGAIPWSWIEQARNL